TSRVHDAKEVLACQSGTTATASQQAGAGAAITMPSTDAVSIVSPLGPKSSGSCRVYSLQTQRWEWRYAEVVESGRLALYVTEGCARQGNSQLRVCSYVKNDKVLCALDLLQTDISHTGGRVLRFIFAQQAAFGTGIAGGASHQFANSSCAITTTPRNTLPINNRKEGSDTDVPTSSTTTSLEADTKYFASGLPSSCVGYSFSPASSSSTKARGGNASGFGTAPASASMAAGGGSGSSTPGAPSSLHLSIEFDDVNGWAFALNAAQVRACSTRTSAEKCQLLSQFLDYLRDGTRSGASSSSTLTGVVGNVVQEGQKSPPKNHEDDCLFEKVEDNVSLRHIVGDLLLLRGSRRKQMIYSRSVAFASLVIGKTRHREKNVHLAVFLPPRTGATTSSSGTRIPKTSKARIRNNSKVVEVVESDFALQSSIFVSPRNFRGPTWLIRISAVLRAEFLGLSLKGSGYKLRLWIAQQEGEDESSLPATSLAVADEKIDLHLQPPIHNGPHTTRRYDPTLQQTGVLIVNNVGDLLDAAGSMLEETRKDMAKPAPSMAMQSNSNSDGQHGNDDASLIFEDGNVNSTNENSGSMLMRRDIVSLTRAPAAMLNLGSETVSRCSSAASLLPGGVRGSEVAPLPLLDSKDERTR
ncbi:unnamed protein product, partial [Amoebophrya sp. A25]